MSEIRQEAIEALPMPIFFMDMRGRYSAVNKSWEMFFGITREDVVGKTAQELFPEHDELNAWAQAPLEPGPNSSTYEAQIRAGDGTLRDVILYKASYAAPNGSIGGVIGTIVDVTERKLAEKRQA